MRALVVAILLAASICGFIDLQQTLEEQTQLTVDDVDVTVEDFARPRWVGVRGNLELSRRVAHQHVVPSNNKHKPPEVQSRWLVPMADATSEVGNIIVELRDHRVKGEPVFPSPRAEWKGMLGPPPECWASAELADRILFLDLDAVAPDPLTSWALIIIPLCGVMALVLSRKRVADEKEIWDPILTLTQPAWRTLGLVALVSGLLAAVCYARLTRSNDIGYSLLAVGLVTTMCAAFLPLFALMHGEALTLAKQGLVHRSQVTGRKRRISWENVDSFRERFDAHGIMAGTTYKLTVEKDAPFMWTSLMDDSLMLRASRVVAEQLLPFMLPGYLEELKEGETSCGPLRIGQTWFARGNDRFELMDIERIDYKRGVLKLKLRGRLLSSQVSMNGDEDAFIFLELLARGMCAINPAAEVKLPTPGVAPG